MEKRSMAIRLGFTALSIFLVGCNQDKLPQGKFSEEQMKQIPFANKYDLPAESGGKVLSLYSETITADEVLQVLEERLKPFARQMNQETFANQTIPFFREVVRGKVTDILLYQEASKTAPENIDEMLEKAVENEVNRFVANYGNNYALAEKAIKEMGMDWKTFREYQKKLIMTQSYLSEEFDKEMKFSYQEMLDYYNKYKEERYCQPGIIEFSLIDIEPRKLKSDQISEGQTPQQAAVKLAENLIKQIEAGADFAELAKQYSHGVLASDGGKWYPVTVGAGSLRKSHQILEEEAVKMSDGQVKGPIVTDDHVFILKLHKSQKGGCKSFEEVQRHIQQMLKYEYQQKLYQDIVTKLTLKSDIIQIEGFVSFCVEEAYRRWSKP